MTPVFETKSNMFYHIKGESLCLDKNSKIDMLLKGELIKNEEKFETIHHCKFFKKYLSLFNRNGFQFTTGGSIIGYAPIKIGFKLSICIDIENNKWISITNKNNFIFHESKITPKPGSGLFGQFICGGVEYINNNYLTNRFMLISIFKNQQKKFCFKTFPIFSFPN